MGHDTVANLPSRLGEEFDCAPKVLPVIAVTGRFAIGELVRGPNRGDGPDMSAPWRIVGAKTAGITPGFRIVDSRGDRLVFYLNKQAAHAGRVSFSAHAPLGDICVTVVSEDLVGLVEELAPSTVRPGGGQPGPAP